MLRQSDFCLPWVFNPIVYQKSMRKEHNYKEAAFTSTWNIKREEADKTSLTEEGQMASLHQQFGQKFWKELSK